MKETGLYISGWRQDKDPQKYIDFIFSYGNKVIKFEFFLYFMSFGFYFPCLCNIYVLIYIYNKNFQNFLICNERRCQFTCNDNHIGNLDPLKMTSLKVNFTIQGKNYDFEDLSILSAYHTRLIYHFVLKCSPNDM